MQKKLAIILISMLILALFLSSNHVENAKAITESKKDSYEIADVLVYNGAGAWDAGVVAF